MRVGEMLDAAITLYRRNYLPLMAIVAFVIVPYSFLEQSVLWSVVRPFEDRLFLTPDEANAGVAVSLLFSALSFLVIQPFVTAAIARATAEVYLGGSPKIGQTYRFASSRTHSILWVTILTAFATIFGVLLVIIGAFLFFVRFYFSTTVVVVEGKKGTKAMRRSWRLAKGSFWKIFGTLLLAGILSAIVAAILTIPFGLAAERMGESGWFLSSLGTSLAQVIVTPFSSIIGVLLYFDMRIRKEGFDLALMAQEVERPAGG
ncbi:MAG: glycerophosphoryl diester phosphodiesterase membrane domain-containing protein [Actinomycetota bacterium]